MGALERLQLAPLNSASIIVGKLLGGTVFGLIISCVMTIITVLFLGAEIINPVVFLFVLLLTNIVHSALGALVAVSVFDSDRRKPRSASASVRIERRIWSGKRTSLH